MVALNDCLAQCSLGPLGDIVIRNLPPWTVLIVAVGMAKAGADNVADRPDTSLGIVAQGEQPQHTNYAQRGEVSDISTRSHVSEQNRKT